MNYVEKSFMDFLASKFGIILSLYFLALLVVIWIIYLHWDKIGAFLKETIDSANSASTNKAILWYQVVVSNLCVWPTWVILSILDNIDNTASMPFTMVDIPGGVLTLYGLANGIPALNAGIKAIANKNKTNGDLAKDGE